MGWDFLIDGLIAMSPTDPDYDNPTQQPDTFTYLGIDATDSIRPPYPPSPLFRPNPDPPLPTYIFQQQIGKVVPFIFKQNLDKATISTSSTIAAQLIHVCLPTRLAAICVLSLGVRVCGIFETKSGVAYI